MSDADEVKSEVVKKQRKPRVPKEKKIEEPEEQKVKWEDLFFILSQAGTSFLYSLARRDDIPDDARHIIRGVIELRDISDGCVVEADRLTPEKALWWADELKQWATPKTVSTINIKKLL